MTEQFSEFVSLRWEEHVVEVTIDRGDGLNALSLQAMRDLKAVADYLAEDTESSANCPAHGQTGHRS